MDEHRPYPLRRGRQGSRSPVPLVGVVPGSLSYDRAKAATAHCKQVLASYQHADVEIAFRESTFTRSVGPRLLNHVPPVDPTADVRVPFTGALGVQIAPKAYSHFEGTGCLYLRDSDRVLLLTARHVVLPPEEYANDAYARRTTSSPRCDVILLGTKAYQNVLEAAMGKIGHDTMVTHYKRALESLGEEVKDEEAITDARGLYTQYLARAEKSIKALTNLHRKTTRFWSTEGQRIIGHVLHAPKISVGVGDERYTEDWALVELDGEKFNDWAGFRGNVMYLGTFRYLSLQSRRLPCLTLTSRQQDLGCRFHSQDAPARRVPSHI
jgi:hypothetical protein